MKTLTLITAMLVFVVGAYSANQEQPPLPPPGDVLENEIMRPIFPEDKPQFNQGRKKGQRIRERISEHWNHHKDEFLDWLETNYPQDALDLSKINKENPERYRQKMLEMLEKYGQLFRAEKDNPELANLIKQDMVLREESKALAREISNLTDEDEKEVKTSQLKELLEKRFDILIKQRELNYQDFKKRIEKLQKDLENREQALNNLKNDKKAQVQLRLKELLSPEDKLNWD